MEDFLTRINNLDKKLQANNIEKAKLEQKRTQIIEAKTQVEEQIISKGETVEGLPKTIQDINISLEKTISDNEAILYA